jgi:hypothetical protein
MNARSHAALALQAYVLSEEQHQELEKLRDNLFLMAHVAFAATQDEEDIPLEMKRSSVGQLFEDMGLRLDEVLMALSCEEWPLRTPARWH